jgi:tRNA(fMet)-specific endonuclease VapC
MIYLLDTGIVIAMSRGAKRDAPRKLAERARQLRKRCRSAQQDGNTLGISTIVVAELEYGARCGDRYVEEMALVHRLLRPFKAFPWDAVDCPWHYAKTRVDLENAGQTIGNMDLLIAAHGLSLHATLVTDNRSHFERVPGLKIAGW